MSNRAIKWLSVVLFWIILKLYNILKALKGFYGWGRDSIRAKMLKYYFTNESDIINREINPKINKKMQHVAICCMEHLEENTERQLLRVSNLINWLQLWNVKYVTLYLDNIGSIHYLEIEKYIERVLRNQFSSQKITWANTNTSKTDSNNLVLNIMTKEKVDQDLQERMRDFWGQDTYSDQSSDILTSNHQLIDFIKKKSELYLPMKKCGKEVIDDYKTLFENHNPDLTLLFNPKDFTLGNFPPLMREFTEMLQWGNLQHFGILNFYDQMTKFLNIRQRWGI